MNYGDDEGEEKQRNPKINLIIDEIDKDNTLDFKNLKPIPGAIEKITDFYRIADATLNRICKNQIFNAKKYTNFKLGENITSIEPLEGKEQEGERAIRELDACQSELMDYMTTYQSIAQITTSIIETQAELCIDDCEQNLNNIPGYDDKLLKQCLSHCFKGTAYAARAAEKILADQADNFTELLDKL